MRNLIRRNTVAGFVAAATLATMAVGLEAQGVKIADPTSVVMIVNRDSNDIAFMDIKTQKMVGKRVPRQQRQPAHGDDVAGRPLRRHRRHPREQGVHHRRQDAAAGEGDPDRYRARASVVLAGQPLVLPGQSRRRLDLGHRHGVADARSRRSPASPSR